MAWSTDGIWSGGTGVGPITRVQSARGESTGNTISVNLGSVPVNGNVLVLVDATGTDGGAYCTITSITQTNVTWTHQHDKQADLGGGHTVGEIWYGVTGAAAGVAITVNLSAAAGGGAVANVCEYSGMKVAGFLDNFADSSGAGFAPDTGTTAATVQAKELWIGNTVCAKTTPVTQSLPTNGFALIDGTYYSWISCAFLEKIVSAVGAANSGTTASANTSWLGLICTFKGA